MTEPVSIVDAPIRLSYRWSAGDLATRSYDIVRSGRIPGNACRSCSAVYVPPRTACPRCWDRCGELVEVSDEGVLEQYVVVNVPFPGQEIGIPYVFGLVRLHGADIALEHIICQADPSGELGMPPDIRIGLPVRAVWRDAAERTGFLNDDIVYFAPAAEGTAACP